MGAMSSKSDFLKGSGGDSEANRVQGEVLPIGLDRQGVSSGDRGDMEVGTDDCQMPNTSRGTSVVIKPRARIVTIWVRVTPVALQIKTRQRDENSSILEEKTVVFENISDVRESLCTHREMLAR